LSIGHLTIGFIGGGHMARAMLGGLLRAGHPAARLAVAEPADAQRALVTDLGAVRVTPVNAEVAASSDILVLAVKPQVVPAVLSEIAGLRRPTGQLVLSVAAGVTLAALGRALGTGSAIVRAMPNQPALIGEGVAALVASQAVSPAQRDQAFRVVAATGHALWLEREDLMDAVTAVSGSGPAYFYLLMEMMEEAAATLGLERDVARRLVRQTALGAARMAGDPASDVAALRAGVTSPGGTTAAALEVLERAGIRALFGRAIAAARDRGAELGRQRG
jgi:pyrroline-5-carboxylate reductase